MCSDIQSFWNVLNYSEKRPSPFHLFSGYLDFLIFIYGIHFEIQILITSESSYLDLKRYYKNDKTYCGLVLIANFQHLNEKQGI